MLRPLIFYPLYFMKNRLTKEQSYILLFSACIISRLATAIFYIEDIDSLRFALSISEYNLLKLQPHFPGYPVYCFMAKILFFSTNSLGVTFSLLGGSSIFFIILFTLKFCNIQLNTLKGFLFTIIIFFNPILWLMGNRYMPDLMGLAVLVSSLYLLTYRRTAKLYQPIGYLLIGILAGIRLSYLPFLMVPFIYHLIGNKERVRNLLLFNLGIALWFIPLIWISGFENLYLVATKQTIGHFSDFGGTIITENNWYDRFINLFRSIWADGMGGYWSDRSWQTLILSFPLGFLLFRGAVGFIENFRNDKIQILLFVSVIVYIIWIFFFQNIIHKSRHVLPIIIFLFFLLNIGKDNILIKKSIFENILLGLFFLSLINVTLTLVIQHKKPTAVSKLKDDILDSPVYKTVLSIPLINYYLAKNGVDAEYLSVENQADLNMINSFNKDSILVVGNFAHLFQNSFQQVHEKIFFHNPYVNRMWSKIETYKIIKKFE
ncbi:MAG: hypothetical protein CMG74_09275 [Candidatus Marinimicrobia bacterium]|nr:hypothetical protein [Candidatus Neomarinimicrobiota bacterium]